MGRHFLVQREHSAGCNACLCPLEVSERYQAERVEDQLASARRVVTVRVSDEVDPST